MAYVMSTGMGAEMARIGTIGSEIVPATQRKGMAAVVKRSVPFLREHLTRAQQKSLSPRSSPRAALAPPPPPSPPEQQPVQQQLLTAEPTEESSVWYYVAGGVALLGVGVAAYLYMR